MARLPIPRRRERCRFSVELTGKLDIALRLGNEAFEQQRVHRAREPHGLRARNLAAALAMFTRTQACLVVNLCFDDAVNAGKEVLVGRQQRRSRI